MNNDLRKQNLKETKIYCKIYVAGERDAEWITDLFRKRKSSNVWIFSI